MGGKKVRDIMKTDVISVSEDATLKSCAALMRRKKVGSLIVKNKKRVVGIVTEQDLTRKAVAKNINPSKHKVKEIMSKNIQTIKPDYDVLDAMSLMKDKKIEHLPVVEDGKLKGLISAKNVIKKAYSDHYLVLLLPRFIIVLVIWIGLLFSWRFAEISSSAVRGVMAALAFVLIPLYFLIVVVYTIIRKRKMRI